MFVVIKSYYDGWLNCRTSTDIFGIFASREEACYAACKGQISAIEDHEWFRYRYKDKSAVKSIGECKSWSEAWLQVSSIEEPFGTPDLTDKAAGDYFTIEEHPVETVKDMCTVAQYVEQELAKKPKSLK
jgi:hypothetical protein